MDKETAEFTAGAIALFACAPAIMIGWYRGYNQSILGSIFLLAVILLFICLAAAGGVSVEEPEKGQKALYT